MHTAYTGYQILAFVAIIFIALALDLWSHRKNAAITISSATIWSVFWIIISLGFALYIGLSHGRQPAAQFVSGYILEKSLSVDNLFVFMAIFSSFGLKEADQHRVLYYGILGALVMRLLFIFVGVSLLKLFGTVAMAVFGLFILWSAYKMFMASRSEQKIITDYSNHFIVKSCSKLLPVSNFMDNHKFFTIKDGKRLITPMFLCLVTVEFADLMFAFDSVPAVIAITQEPFLVYTSNIFAIMGLRSMYFILAASKQSLIHLEKAVIVILVFIGLKMLLDTFGGIHISTKISLSVILILLILGVVTSILAIGKKKPKPPSPLEP